jgi:SpoVK/Ycf46/Vps4 family AAA+-type ATPase
MSTGDNGFGVIVLGATNRPQDVDPAFLRRMPRTFEIGLPNQAQREKILRLHLRNEAVDKGFDFRQLGLDTGFYSGRDLKELCRAALMIPLREHIERVREAAIAVSKQDGEIAESAPVPKMRPLSMTDFEEAKTMVQPTGATAYAYEASQQQPDRRSQSGGGAPIDMDMFAAIMAAGLQNLMQASQPTRHPDVQFE